MVDIKRNSARNEPSERSQTDRLLVVSSGPLLGPRIARLFSPPPSAPFLLSISVPVPTPCLFVETFFQLQFFPDHMEWSFIDVSRSLSTNSPLRTTVLASFPAGGRSVGTFARRSCSSVTDCIQSPVSVVMTAIAYLRSDSSSGRLPGLLSPSPIYPTVQAIFSVCLPPNPLAITFRALIRTTSTVNGQSSTTCLFRFVRTENEVITLLLISVAEASSRPLPVATTRIMAAFSFFCATAMSVVATALR